LAQLRGRGVYVAAAIFLAAFGIWYFTEHQSPSRSPSTSASPQPSPLIKLQAADIETITLKARGKVMTLNRATGGAWTYSVCDASAAPSSAACAPAPADSSRVQQEITAIVELRPNEVIYGAPEGFPAYGLDKPSAGEVDLRNAAGSTTVLWLGASAPDQTSQFIRVAGSRDVEVVSKTNLQSQVLAIIDNPPKPAPSPLPTPSSTAGATPPPAGPAPQSP